MFSKVLDVNKNYDHDNNNEVSSKRESMMLICVTKELEVGGYFYEEVEEF